MCAPQRGPPLRPQALCRVLRDRHEYEERRVGTAVRWRPKPVPLRRTGATAQHGVVSADGKWLAYGSDESGREEIYIQRFPTGSPWPVTSGGGHPKWRADGKELFFLDALGTTIMSVSVRATAAGVETSRPATVVNLPAPLPTLVSPYEVSPDGQRFLVLHPVDQSLAVLPITVVLNWDAALKQ